MKMSSTQARRYRQSLIIGDFNFEGVDSFTNLGAVVNNENKMWVDIHSKIMTADRAYSAYEYIELLRSKRLSRNTKLKICKTLIRPILSYVSETWTLTVKEMNALRMSERKIIRKIYGPIKEGDSWRIRTNKEVKDILQGADIVKFIKSSRIRWYGHVERMQNQRMPKQIAAATIEGTKERERSRKRWKYEVEEDLKITGIKNGRAADRDRPKWRKTVLQAKDHNGLWRLRRRIWVGITAVGRGN
jgi:hypothetical protein